MATCSSEILLNDLLDRAACAFEERFRKPPMYAAAAPGRVNLIGEHTDYNDGFVLPIAINRHAVIVAGPTRAKKSTLYAPDLGETAKIDMTGDFDPVCKQFANHLLGVAYQYWLGHAEFSNFNLLLTSTVPIGAGLGSRGAVEVAMAFVLEQITGLELDPVTRAMACQQAEHDFVGTPCGIMDMLASIRGEPGAALLIDCSNNRCQAVPMPSDDELAVLVIDTGVRHDLTTGDYGKRRQHCENAARKLGVAVLRDANAGMIESCGGLTADEYRCAQHVVQDNNRVLLAAAALREHQLERMGDLMFASHDSLRDLMRVSSPELDTLVDVCRRLRESGRVYGGRMTGGGFGGSVVALCPPKDARDVSDELRSALGRHFGRDGAVMRVTACGGASAVEVPPNRSKRK